MRNVLLHSAALLCLLTFGGAAEARKLFVRELRVAPSCVAASPEALLAVIAQQVPRDVLSRRDLRYEDLPSYLDLANWSPERFEVRRTASVLHRLQQLDMRYMVWLELSCLPAGGSARFMLSGRLTDLDVMDRVLSCPAAQAGSRGGRRVCNVGGEVFDAVSFTSVELRTFDDFAPAVRELFARLLHVPELSVATTLREFDPSEEIDVPFLVRRNDGSEPGYSGTPASVRAYRMREDVAEIPSDLFDEVCRAPASHWDQIACRGGFADGRCDRAEPVRYEVRSLLHREVAARAQAMISDDDRGGDRIVFRAPSHAAHFLVRAEAIADERGGAVRSNPVFLCLRVRARTAYFGVASRLGVPFGAVSSGASYPTAGFVTPAWGVDAVLQRHLFSSGASLLPNNALQLVLGFSKIDGTYPCPTGDNRACETPELPPQAPRRTSSSVTIEARLQLWSELFRVGRVAPMVVSELGAGLEDVSSQVTAFRNDGWGAMFMAGVGGGLSMTLGRSGHASTRVWLTAQWQMRSRFSDRATPIYLRGDSGTFTWMDAAGVPDTFQMVWISAGVGLAPTAGVAAPTP